jgi:hypothetical protein
MIEVVREFRTRFNPGVEGPNILDGR